jgi:hypothetical protein
MRSGRSGAKATPDLHSRLLPPSPYRASPCLPTDPSHCSFFPRSPVFHLGLEWHGQMQPGRLQSVCLVSYVAFSLQKEEIIEGQTPSGYPGKELSVGSGDVSG